MAGGRVVRRKRIRKRKRKLLFSILLVLFLSTIGYSAFQFAAGQSYGQENGGVDKDKEENLTDQFDNRAPKESNEDKKVNVLLVGSDQRENEVSRTDTIMVAQYDMDNNLSKIVSIMRDTYVDIPGYGYNKINASYSFGDVPLLTETIEKNFDIRIDHFAVVNFEGFQHIVDTIAPNGIKIDVEKRMKYQDGAGTIDIDLQPGVQTLNGKQLLDYARFRNDAQSDFGRVRRQQQVMTRLKSELLSITSVPKLPKTIGMLNSYISTDMTKKEMGIYGAKFVVNPPDNIETMKIPIDGSYWDETYRHAGAVLAHDEEKNRKAINEFLGSPDTEKEE